MILEDLSFQSCGWLSGQGPSRENVLSSRIRLARNIDGFAFSHWASTGELAKLISLCSAALRSAEALADSEELELEAQSQIDLEYLQERHQISHEMAQSQNQRTAFIAHSQTLGAMVAEEDHLRLQVILPGLDLGRAWDLCNSLDNDIATRLTYAYSEDLGHLTACPTNVGTGLRCSVMVHLPALVMTRQIQKMIAAVSQLGMTARGPLGEGSEIKGNLFQISNQVTLGLDEEVIIDKLSELTRQILESEREATEQLLEEAREDVLDRAMRAYGILVCARKLTSKETLELLSPLRLGVTTGVFKDVTLESLNEVFLYSRPAHLQKLAEKSLESKERDIFRAEYVREKLKN